MDALVRAALDKVNEEVKGIDTYCSAQRKAALIVKAINCVDALKSALKAI